MMALLHNPLVISVAKAAAKGALAGWASAAVVDYRAFRAWKSFHDAYAYDWPVALFRWIQGAFSGAVTGVLVALGLAAID